MRIIISLIALCLFTISFAQVYDFGKNSEVGKILHLKDADIYYEVYGKGKPLFLIHGNGGSIGAFQKKSQTLN
ncbi:hypothetical protein [Epilithonimonas sp.]|uniref:hypothetical protein n=1 Tax=Epilithonimonas sp. TaxID=2894511 RepID=UPI002FDCB5E7